MNPTMKTDPILKIYTDYYAYNHPLQTHRVLEKAP